MYFTLAKIRSLMLSHYYYQDAVDLYLNDKAISLKAKELPNRHIVVEGCFAGQSYFDRNEKTNSIIDFDLVNNNFTARCSCYMRTKNNYICQHEAALLLYCNEIKFNELPFNYQLYRSQIVAKRQELYNRLIAKDMKDTYIQNTDLFLSEFSSKDALYKVENPLTAGPFYLSIEMSTAPYSFQISFKVGNEKAFVIKSIKGFLDHLDRKEVYSYSKKLTFKHENEAFAKECLPAIDLMRNLYSYCLTDERPRSFSVNCQNVDIIYSTIANYPAGLTNIKTITEERKLTINCTKDEDGDYVLTLGCDLNNSFFNEKGFYTIYPQFTEEESLQNGYNTFTLAKNSLNSSKRLARLLEELNTYKKSIFLRSHQLVEFYQNFVKPLSSIVDFKGFPEINDNFESKVAIYGNVGENETVEFTIKCIYPDLHEELATTLSEDLKSPLVNKILNTFKQYNGVLSADKTKIIFDATAKETQTFMNSVLPLINQDAEVYLENSLLNFDKKTNHSIKVGLSYSNDLLHLNISSIDIPTDQLADVLKAYRKKNRFYRLKNGATISLYSDDLKELDELLTNYDIAIKDLNQGEAVVNPYRAFALDKEQGSNLVIERNNQFTGYLQNFDNLKDDDFEIKDKFKAILRDYQRFGIEWMHHLNRLNFSGILADDMGLGKTLEVIALLESEQAKPALVVCPSSLILNWDDEIHKFNSDLKALPIYGSKSRRNELIASYKDYDLLITSYDYLRNDIDEYKNISFDTVILDEAQYIKNQNTKNANAVKQLKSKHRFALTGTPIENSLAELWSIFDFLMPGYLFNYNYFKKNFESAIINKTDDETSVRLKNMVSPFILRRNKKDVLTELPDKEEHTILVDFNEEERKLYLANLMQANKMLQQELKNASIDKIAILAMITRLRQLCGDARLVYENVDFVSSKINSCIDLLSTLKDNNKKVLLFSAFTGALELIERELIKNGITYFKLTGADDKESRHDMVERFQSGEVDVFLISLKAGGTGLNLTTAEAVIHFDPWWNLSAQNQATDRAYRIGQHNNVQVYKMIVKDSIEERILELQQKKLELSDMFVENNDGSLMKMSKEDLQNILSLN